MGDKSAFDDITSAFGSSAFGSAFEASKRKAKERADAAAAARAAAEKEKQQKELQMRLRQMPMRPSAMSHGPTPMPMAGGYPGTSWGAPPADGAAGHMPPVAAHGYGGAPMPPHLYYGQPMHAPGQAPAHPDAGHAGQPGSAGQQPGQGGQPGHVGHAGAGSQPGPMPGQPFPPYPPGAAPGPHPPYDPSHPPGIGPGSERAPGQAHPPWDPSQAAGHAPGQRQDGAAAGHTPPGGFPQQSQGPYGYPPPGYLPQGYPGYPGYMPQPGYPAGGHAPWQAPGPGSSGGPVPAGIGAGVAPLSVAPPPSSSDDAEFDDFHGADAPPANPPASLAPHGGAADGSTAGASSHAPGIGVQGLGLMHGASMPPSGAPVGPNAGFGVPPSWPYAPHTAPGQPLDGVPHAPWHPPGQDGQPAYPPPHIMPWGTAPPPTMPPGSAPFGMPPGPISGGASHDAATPGVLAGQAASTSGGEDDGFGDFADAPPSGAPAPPPQPPAGNAWGAPPPFPVAGGQFYGHPAGGVPQGFYPGPGFPHGGPPQVPPSLHDFPPAAPGWNTGHAGPAAVPPVASSMPSAAAVDDSDFGEFASVDPATATAAPEAATPPPSSGFPPQHGQPGAHGVTDSGFDWSHAATHDASKDAFATPGGWGSSVLGGGSSTERRLSLDAGAPHCSPSFEASFPADFSSGIPAHMAAPSPAQPAVPAPAWANKDSMGPLPELSLDDFCDPAAVVVPEPSATPAQAASAAAPGAHPPLPAGASGGGAGPVGAADLDFGDFEEADGTPAVVAPVSADASNSAAPFAAFGAGVMPLGGAAPSGHMPSPFGFGDSSHMSVSTFGAGSSFGVHGAAPFGTPTAFGSLGEAGAGASAPLSESEFGDFAEVPPTSAPSASTSVSTAPVPSGVTSELDFGDFADAGADASAPGSTLPSATPPPAPAVVGSFGGGAGGFGSGPLFSSPLGDTSFGDFEEASASAPSLSTGAMASGTGGGALSSALPGNDFGDFSEAQGGSQAATSTAPAPAAATFGGDKGSVPTSLARPPMLELDFGDFAEAEGERSAADASTGLGAGGSSSSFATSMTHAPLGGVEGLSSVLEFGEFEGEEATSSSSTFGATTTVAAGSGGADFTASFGEVSKDDGGALSDSEFGGFSEAPPTTVGASFSGVQETSASGTSFGGSFAAFPSHGDVFASSGSFGEAASSSGTGFAPPSGFAAFPAESGGAFGSNNTFGSNSAFGSSDAVAGRMSSDASRSDAWGVGVGETARGAAMDGGLEDSFGDFTGPGSPGYKDPAESTTASAASMSQQGVSSQAGFGRTDSGFEDEQGGDDWGFQGAEPGPAAAPATTVSGDDEGFGDFSSGLDGGSPPAPVESEPLGAGQPGGWHGASNQTGPASSSASSSAAPAHHGGGGSSLNLAEKKGVLLQLMEASQAAACSQGLYSLERRAFACAVQALMMGPRLPAGTSSEVAPRAASRRLSLLLGVEQQAHAHADASKRGARLSHDGGESCSLLSLLKHGQVEGMAVSAYALSCRQCGVVLLMAGATDGGRVCLTCGQPQGSLPAGVAGRWQWSACQRRWVASLGLHRTRVPVADARAADPYGAPLASGPVVGHRGPGHAPNVDDLVDDAPQGADSAMDKWLESLEHGGAHSSKAAAASVARPSPAKGGPAPVRTRSEEGSVGGSVAKAAAVSSGTASAVASPLAIGGAPLDLMDMGVGTLAAASSTAMDRGPRTVASSGDLFDLLGGGSGEDSGHSSSLGGGLASSRSSISLSLSSPHMGGIVGVATPVDSSLHSRNHPMDASELLEGGKPLSTPTVKVSPSGGSFTGGRSLFGGGRATDDKLMVASKQQSFTSPAVGAAHSHSQSLGAFPTDLLSLYDASPAPPS
eukprot:jgi/Mesvir1/19431/Mv10461-RA.1